MKNKTKKIVKLVGKLFFFFLVTALLKIFLLKDVGEFATILCYMAVYFLIFRNKTLLESLR